jgi:hypothetical protein
MFGLLKRSAANGTPESAAEFEPLSVQVHYELRDPLGGVQFVLPEEGYPGRFAHIAPSLRVMCLFFFFFFLFFCIDPSSWSCDFR